MYVVFKEKAKCQEFLDKIEKIASIICPYNTKQFICLQNTFPKPVSDYLRMRNLHVPYLETEHDRLVL